MELNPNLLALGGVAAIVAAGWQQVKLAIGQLRSVLIVKSYLHGSLSNEVSLHLRREWKRLPTSDIEYGVTYRTIGADLFERMIAFRMPPYQVAVFYKGWRLVILVENQYLLSLRGMVDVDAIVLAGVAIHDENVATKEAPDRYWRMDVMGLDAKRQGRDSNSKRSIDRGDVAESPKSLTSAREPNPLYDLPLGYTRDQILSAKTKQDPFTTLVYEQDVMDNVERAMQWLSQRDWYNSRGIPWRRGWLLSGPPGTGKSRLCRAMAQKMRIPIYTFHLNTLSDQEFVESWDHLQMPCIVAFEDFDNVFDGRTNVRADCTLSFDCVLNQISGIGTNDGLFLIVTTNHPEKLDPAMGKTPEPDSVGGKKGLSSRPGRVDTSMHLGYISQANKERMADRILDQWPHLAQRMLVENPEPNLTAAQFEKLCGDAALEQLALDEKDLVHGGAI